MGVTLTAKDIVVHPVQRQLLNSIGASDRRAGIHYTQGWKKVSEECDYADRRTPVREAYEDGWFSVPASELPKETAP